VLEVGDADAHRVLTELLKQPQVKPVAVEDQVIALFAGTRGYLDGIPVSAVGKFERMLLSELHATKPEIVASIRGDQQIKPDVEKQLIAFLDGFAKTFA
jgi:F-type H+-transporting ATPase subunit alpha